MSLSIFLLLLLSTVQVSSAFNCYKCSLIGISDAGLRATVAQFLSSYVTFPPEEASCASNPVAQVPGCNLACVHIKLMVDFSQYSGPQLATYTREQIRSLGHVPVSIRDCLELQWPTVSRYVTWGYLPKINPEKSCFELTGGIYGTPVGGELCLANTGDYRAQNPDLSEHESDPAQPTATQPRLPISYQDCSQSYMPNSNMETILTMAGYKVPTSVNVNMIDPALHKPAKLAQLQKDNSNFATCFFPVGDLKQGCTQMAYSAGIRVNMTAYSGEDIVYSNLLRLSQEKVRAFNYTSAIARGCISELPGKGLPVPANLAYPSIPEGDNCFDLHSDIWDLQLSSQICLCNKDGCNTHEFNPLFPSSAVSNRIAIPLIAAQLLFVSISFVGW
uniref:Uncharacterized protein n=1 Tax=Plectus sambesii TaxID=2011161 RepID=A0A914X4U6_9BILA